MKMLRGSRRDRPPMPPPNATTTLDVAPSATICPPALPSWAMRCWARRGKVENPVVVATRACSIAAPVQPPYLGGGDYKTVPERAGRTRHPAKRAPLANRVIGALRGLDAGNWAYTFVYMGLLPVGTLSGFCVPVLCEGFCNGDLRGSRRYRNSRLVQG